MLLCRHFFCCAEFCHQTMFSSNQCWYDFLEIPNPLNIIGVVVNQRIERKTGWIHSTMPQRHEHQWSPMDLANFTLPVVSCSVKHTFIWNPLNIVHDQTCFKRSRASPSSPGSHPPTQTMAHVQGKVIFQYLSIG